ncbi:hypothetical protein IHV12_16815 [Fictibacillus sp. 7GRE50]|uniref:YphA family membrane protein n=1 Tax=unclassified Fictibacillus TaxID=2644029 RepID=UPI0018CD8777|nr:MULTISPECIES: hypothetical protein [unclassified Fictibacillus]MBH0166583.1 hypothetical protein [Fictibacillus sp. 7GRE50]MBH0174407.1 hypothetical protein [Fictibacillus sp. 23RED33]
MNDGILFYWFMWMGWIVSTFLMKKGQLRNQCVFMTLLGIILSGVNIHLSIGSMNAAFVFFLLMAFVHVIKNSHQIFFFVTSSFIVATAFVSIELFALYDPAKLFVNKELMILIFLTLLVITLARSKKDHFSLIAIGLFIGDAAYQFIILRLVGKVEIGSLYVMDLFASTSMMLLFMVVLVDMFKKIRRTAFKRVTSAKQI